MDLKEAIFSPDEKSLVTRAALHESQQEHEKVRPADVKLDEEQPPLWRHVSGQIWVPKPDLAMQRALYALAHQGISGHRGRDATMTRLEAEVKWDGMRKDVEAWRKLCLQCLKLAEGEVVPRPLASQILAEYPGEVLMADYIKLGASRTGLNYILMLVDKFTRFVLFVPTVAATAIEAARAILLWASMFGLPKWLVSDGRNSFWISAFGHRFEVG